MAEKKIQPTLGSRWRNHFTDQYYVVTKVLPKLKIEIREESNQELVIYHRSHFGINQAFQPA